MKITCEACGSRYAVPDEMRHQANQSLKIRCKNCGAMITVAASEDAGTADTGDRWFYAVDTERMGPISLEGLRVLVEDGEVTGESLVWCRGMDEWQPACEVEALDFVVDAVDMIPETSGGIFDDLAMEDAGQASHIRNDTSVLFSLDDLNDQETPGDVSGADFLTDTSGLIDLRRVAARQEERSSTPNNPFHQFSEDEAPFASGGTGVGMAVPMLKRRRSRGMGVWIAVALAVAGLGFGAWALKDVLMGSSGPDAAGVESAVVTKASPPSDPTPAAAPAVVTPATPDASAAPWTSGDAAVAADGASTDDAGPAPSVDAAATPAAAPSGAVKVAEAPAATVKEKPATSTTKPARAGAKARTKKAGGGRGKSKTSSSSKSKAAGAKRAAGPKKTPAKKKTPAAAPAKKPTASTGAKPSGGVNDLLKSLSARKKTQAGTEREESGLPQRLSASMVRSTLRKHRGSLSGCRELMSDPAAGTITVKTSVVIKGSGSVASARVVSSGGAPGSVQSCIVRVLKKVRFPRFRDPKMTINYPIQLR